MSMVDSSLIFLPLIVRLCTCIISSDWCSNLLDYDSLRILLFSYEISFLTREVPICYSIEISVCTRLVLILAVCDAI